MTAAPVRVIGAYVCLYFVLLALSGTPLDLSARYLLHLTVFVIVPGVCVYRLLGGHVMAWYRQLALGWAIGWVLEASFWFVTGWQQTPVPFYLYPVAAAALEAARRWRAGPAEEADEQVTPAPLLVAGMGFPVLVVLIFFAGALAPPAQGYLPGTCGDIVWHAHNAIGVRDYFPPQDASLSGHRWYYHLLFNAHVASVSGVSGVPVFMGTFRLAQLAMAFLLGLTALMFGVSLFRSPWLGVAGLFMALFVNTGIYPPKTGMIGSYACSPSTVLGTIFALGALALAYELIANRRGERWRPFVLFLVCWGCAAAKSTILPALGVGIALFAVAGLAMTRRLSARSIGAGLVVVLAFVSASWFLYPLTSERGTMWAFPSVVSTTWPSDKVATLLGGFVPFPAIVPIIVVIDLGLYALTLVYLVVQPPTARLHLGVGFLAAFAIGTIGLSRLLRFPGASEFYFLWYGRIVLGFLTALVLLHAWERRYDWRRKLFLGVAGLFVVSGLWTELVASVRDGLRDIRAAAAGEVVPRGTYAPEFVEVTDWLRHQTRPNDVVALNLDPRDCGSASVEANMNFARASYFSAMGERRFLIESVWASVEWARRELTFGDRLYPLPNPSPEACPEADRLVLNTRIFAGDVDALGVAAREWGVKFLLIDHELYGRHALRPDTADRVFRNGRFEIFRIRERPSS